MSSMEWSSVCWVWVLLVLLQSQIHASLGYLEEERIALLEFKAFANVTDDTYLTSWDDKTDCCAWPRVKCNHTNERVIELSLNHTIPIDAVRYLNATIFLAFVDLRLLDLSSNYLDGFERLHGLRRLQVLDLSNNCFNISILLSLVGFLSLKTSSLASNEIIGMIPNQDCNPVNRLEILDVSNNRRSGEVPSCIRTLPSLKTLSLRGNQLNGSLNSQGFCQLKNVQELDLSENEFRGSLPPCLNNFTSLRMLDLSENQFNGTFPTFLVNSNNFKGSISIQMPNSLYLTTLEISNNNISGRLPIWIGNLSNLKTLLMSQNNLDGTIPVENCKLNRLQVLGLSRNNFFGSLPSCFNSSSLRHLYLQRNMFTGPISDALSMSSSLVTLDLRDNNFSGGISIWINMLSNLKVLLLRGTLLRGQITVQLCQLDKISILDLSHNRLFGSIPSCLKNLTFGRNVTDDAFLPIEQGEFFWGFYAVSEIGYIGKSVTDYQPVITWDIEVEVEFITKKRSEFYKGHILMLMSGMDLSWNQLTGDIPLEIGELSEIHALNLSHNHLIGSIPETFSNLKNIESMDLSYNSLSGPIPSQVTDLSFLAIFNVSYNNLSGKMPDHGQFGSFDETNYGGNPDLCGPRLKKSCDDIEPPSKNGEDDGVFINMVSFYWSFVASYVVELLGFITILHINTNWRRAWFCFIDKCISSCCNWF
ncbi:hypothetical protein HHK36_025840 [Tetracentron sinense]|uniref:Leucine-rich repeat-containing N-terminal plant-type domain-containing protein n=1 Tax=Tetracentron sinense TaxID=13715 RepID=A0A835D5Y3_TETSI|nr:hypothetical protein HHK36_025840 [Tetracentron sinense]